MTDENKKNIIDVLDDEVYATVKQLNDEAKVRTENDLKIINDFTVLRKATISKFTETNNLIAVVKKDLSENINKLEAQQEETQTKINEMNDSITHIDQMNHTLSDNIDQLSEEVKTTEENVKNNQDRIDDLEADFFECIKQLANEHEELVSKLTEANKTIEEKDDVISKQEDEIKKYWEEIHANGDESSINLRFAEPLKFEITQVMSVKDFINNYLKEVVISRMNDRHPEASWMTDYSICLDGLDYNDVMQGKNLTAIVYATPEGELNGESSFDLIVSHIYDVTEMGKFINEFLLSAIPESLRNIDENAAPDYKIPEEIVNIKPLKLLLNSKEFKYLPFKIFAEMNAASYWTDFHRPWQFIKDGYFGTGQSAIGTNKNINTVRELYNNLGYYNSIFKLIEQRLNDSGVACTVTKKWVRHSRGSKTLHTLGNLPFNVTSINLDNTYTSVTKRRYYYIMVNFEVNFSRSLKKLYRGVTLVFSDNLELY